MRARALHVTWMNSSGSIAQLREVELCRTISLGYAHCAGVQLNVGGPTFLQYLVRQYPVCIEKSPIPKEAQPATSVFFFVWILLLLIYRYGIGLCSDLSRWRLARRQLVGNGHVQ